MDSKLPDKIDDAINSDFENVYQIEKPESVVEVDRIDLDFVLVNELGQFGRYQLVNMMLITVPLMLTAATQSFVFTAASTPHRCQIPECGEYSKDAEFSPPWIANAIMVTTDGINSCERYAPKNITLPFDECPAKLFDTSKTVKCQDFVYENNNTVVYEFNLGCRDWLRVLSGMFSNLGSLIVLLIVGYLSDRFGRRIALVVNAFNLALLGVIQALSINYPMYLVLQILQTTLGAGGFSSGYIIATELVGPKYRVLAGATSSSMFSLGQVILGCVAWLIKPWRYFSVAVFAPSFIVVSYNWFYPESIRWLLSKGRFDEAKKLLETAASMNGKKISEKSMKDVLQAPKCKWISTTFVYYGLSITSTGLSETMHLNYILTCAIEIPGFLSSVLILNKIGRKPTLCGGYFLVAACNIAFIFVGKEFTTLRLILFLLGKFCVSLVFTSLYLFTSELYPTEYRHTLLAFSSMVGRIGSTIAPLTPVLVMYWIHLPSLLFGIMGLLSGILVLTQPETLGTKMPDTLAEAEGLGRKLVDENS